MSQIDEKFLKLFRILGMHWGIRKREEVSNSNRKRSNTEISNDILKANPYAAILSPNLIKKKLKK